MSAPTMVSRNGDNLIVRSVVSGDPLFGTCPDVKEDEDSFLSQPEAEEEYCLGELPQCKIKRNYTCPNCDYYTQNPRFYLYHQKQVHNEKIKIYECPNCLYASKHSQKLQRHVHMVHVMGNAKKKAMKPRKVAPSPVDQQLQQPVTFEAEEPTFAEDGTQIFKCRVCGEKYKSENLLAKHERQVHLKRKFYRCAKCNYVTHMKARYTKHVKYHSMPMIKCELCDFKTPYKWNLDRHNKNHMGDGAFKCSICNFTADIKQSLTVHEMNHHVPPVGHILSASKRRLKVGASDSQGLITEEDQIEHDELELLKMERESSFPEQANPADFVQAQLDIPEFSHSDSNSPPSLPIPGLLQSPIMLNRLSLADDRLITIRKYKCKMCEFEGNLGEVHRHEAIMHNNSTVTITKKKAPRPIPNLIPIQGQPGVKQNESKDTRSVSPPQLTVTKESYNIPSKEFAPNFGNDQENRHSDRSANNSPADLTAKKIPDAFKKKNASFFDKLKEKLMTSASESNLTCSYCGYEAKCLSEHMKHQRSHMLSTENGGGDSEENSRGSSTQNMDTGDQLSSTRCRHCRTRFKTNASLLQHLPLCFEQQASLTKTEKTLLLDNMPPTIKIEDDDPEDDEHPDDEDDEDDDEDLGLNDHPEEFGSMENKVFIWNTINSENGGSGHVGGPNGNDKMPQSGDKVAEDEAAQHELLDRSLLGVEVKPGYGIIARTLEEKEHATSKDLSLKKVFKCPHCSFWASTASRFHVHIVGHLNKRPFQCSLCYYSSNWRWDITKHIRLKTLRDPSHARAKVLLTDETGRRNYSKYNKYLTTMRMELSSSAQAALDSGGGAKDSGSQFGTSPGAAKGISGSVVSKLTRKLLPKDQHGIPAGIGIGKKRPANFNFDEDGGTAFGDANSKETPKRRHSENKRTMWKCKKCYFRDGDRSVVLAHVKEHYREAGHLGKRKLSSDTNPNENPMRSPPIAVNNQQSMNDQEHFGNEECPDFMCETCPFIAGTLEELEAHCERHFVSSNTTHKCQFCPYYACNKQELLEHYDMHSEAEAEDSEPRKGVIYACFACPYVATSHAQLVYHKNWHRPDNAAATHGCIRCTYGAPNNMFLSLHVRLHGRNNLDNLDTMQPTNTVKRKVSSNGGAASTGGSGGLGERKPADISGVDTTNYTEIPMVWVSKPMGISKMFKCRFCPHVNMRKSNIQEHEKMHGARDVQGQTAHLCSECNYVCNNPGVLSSHAKVHAAFFGTVVGVVDHTKTDEIQIEEMRDKIAQLEESFPAPHTSPSNRIDDNATDSPAPGNDTTNADEDKILHFCNLCPARFMLSKEISIHTRFHQLELPFKCESCTYTARQRQHLMAHTKVHSDEYQERTNALVNVYTVSEENPRPKVAVVLDDEGPKTESMWVVVNSENKPETNGVSDNQKSNSQPKSFLCDKCPAEFFKSVALSYHKSLHGGPGPHKCRSCDYAVKTYGNLIRHEMIHQGERNVGRIREATEKQKQIKTSQPPQLQRDPEFGLLIHGSPDFVYPTYVKNGKTKEKRYKCHKCPSAFEKREQYKIHLSLHGSKQRYNCERCDYSVKYYANYSQHIKKHEMNDATRKGRTVTNGGISSGCVSGDEEINNEYSTEASKTRPIPPISRAGKSLKISVADQQALMVMQQRFVSNSVSDKEAVISRCPYCPYANNRRDGVTGHVRSHTNNKETAFSCKYCQYNVPQMHRLREHLKMHFAPIKFMKPEAYMKVDRLELYAEPVDPNHNSAEKRILVFKDNGDNYPKKARFEPELMDNFVDYVEQTERNRGRVYINLKTGAEEIELDEPEENCKSEEVAEEDVENSDVKENLDVADDVVGKVTEDECKTNGENISVENISSSTVTAAVENGEEEMEVDESVNNDSILNSEAVEAPTDVDVQPMNGTVAEDEKSEETEPQQNPTVESVDENSSSSSSVSSSSCASSTLPLDQSITAQKD